MVTFCSVCFGDRRYLDQQTRLHKSITDIDPNANIRFWYNEYPPGSREFGKSLYGFKVHAIKAVLNEGFREIVWLDPAMILVDPDLSDMTRYDLAAVRDDHKLNPFISDQALAYHGITREEIAEVHLVGGSLYYFDFNEPSTRSVFNTWYEAEKADLFDGEGQIHTGATRGHRNDEALMALAMYMNNVEPVTHADIRYCIDDNPMWRKFHFK